MSTNIYMVGYIGYFTDENIHIVLANTEAEALNIWKHKVYPDMPIGRYLHYDEYDSDMIHSRVETGRSENYIISGIENELQDGQDLSLKLMVNKIGNGIISEEITITTG